MSASFLLPPEIISFSISSLLLIFAGLLLIISCIYLIFSKNLLESIMLMSVFSVLITLCYLLMDAPDVAMTEVALGACLSTAVLLNFLKLIDAKDINNLKSSKIIPAILLCFAFIIALTFAAFDLPMYGDLDSPLQSHLTKYYLENTKADIGLPSFVASILASYRGYDTLGETTVILIAGMAVLLLSCNSGERGNDGRLINFPIIKTITLFAIPYIFFYGAYIQINGEVSPGGGFQAGVIFATALIAFDLIHGKEYLTQYLNINLCKYLSVLGVMLYASVGLISLIFDDNYLNYYSISSNKLLGQSIGIFTIELGVGLTVTSVMCLIYLLLQNDYSSNSKQG